LSDLFLEVPAQRAGSATRHGCVDGVLCVLVPCLQALPAKL
jgi:hypothetical protein